MTVTTKLLTTWGQHLTDNPDEIPLNDYPRPQIVRANWQNLNGWWDYAITKELEPPTHYDGKIRVPFSPETQLSGVEKMVGPTDILWYRVKFKHTKKASERTLLHFGAVDMLTIFFLNGKNIGQNLGNYVPVSFDISPYLAEENELVVGVADWSDNPVYAYGKQKLDHGGIWYTPQSGIWQTVWLEDVPWLFIANLILTPDFDTQQVHVEVMSNGAFAQGHLTLSSAGQVISETELTTADFLLDVPDMISWTPDNPHLYQVDLTYAEDHVTSYFGMRKFSVETTADGVKVPCLNNEPIFFNGLLDQGYWSDGLYTAPSDEALIWDIQTMKNLGFNTLRKHIKIEPMRWYYHCDRLGMLVWQDFVSGGQPYRRSVIQVLPFLNITLKDTTYKKFGRELPDSREQFRLEVARTVGTLESVTSIAVWVPFNEGWGQFDSADICHFVKDIDGRRLVDAASGYHDQGAGDFKSPHVYFKKYRLKKDPHERVQVLSEFGGYSLPTAGHMAADKLFGYKKFTTRADLMTAYEKLFNKEILPAIEQGLSGTIYTQVSDVEDEINGLVTFDRRVIKVDEEAVRAQNQKMTAAFAKRHHLKIKE